MSENLERLIDRYESQIENLEEKIDLLEDEKSKLECFLDDTECGWSRHRKFEGLIAELPVPRLQIQYEVISGFKVKWFYSFVYKHLVGDLIVVPMGETLITGKPYEPENMLEAIYSFLPYRDGTHIRHDMEHLNLPAYAIVNNQAIKLKGLTQNANE